MSEPQTVYLADYRPYPFDLGEVALTFRLAPSATRVISRFTLTPKGPAEDLVLFGDHLQLIRATLNGNPVTARPEGGVLRIPAADLPEGPLTWEAEVEIDPAANTALEGLYMSNGMYCTQCEAEGFRRITYYPDRPDVMTTFRVRIESDLPVLLSNGNQVASGPGFAEWHDPWPKPAYLFALVAGDLRARPGQFTTLSGRDVALNIWVRPGDEDRCDWALTSLKASTKWDEEVYGREYDLDIFNIVAVDDFNMGAMENKGLNIFNSRAVLARPDTATDADFQRIEAIIAHEYFHNWTGNRITCRDWFQLCLKEGLTVFRDQQFTADLRGAAVKRIEDALTLRDRQFREDSGPLAHPVRPSSFVEINNFYTATVYEKGAELIGMLKRLVGDEGYRKALDLYFTRHDGQACTIEDWLKVFEEATGRDLSQFARWYSQAGTPRVEVTEDWDDSGTFTLTLRQSQPETPDGVTKLPLHIPVVVGLLNPNGDEVLPSVTLELTQAEQSFRFDNLTSRPVASVLRDFSAPVILSHAQSDATRAFLLAHDTDPFNRWEAGRTLARAVLARLITEGTPPGADWLEAMAALLRDDSLDPAFRALCLRLPGEDDMAATLADSGHVPDPDRIHRARRQLQTSLAQHLAPQIPALMTAMTPQGPYSPDPVSAGQRSLKNTLLALQSRLDGGRAAQAAFAAADNMTDLTAALAYLIEAGTAGGALKTFEARYRDDRLVLDKWFMAQVVYASPETAAQVADALTAHPKFDLKNPNRFRAVFGVLSANHAGFHRADGTGYRLLADWLLRLDALNPQTAARMSTAFETWRRYDADRQALIRQELTRLQQAPNLSRDLGEMVTRMLG
ncbi:aminopeptidase N [Falsigemmobacter intermedius]|uniref:Aminopeptidase N n=1 Tax=Falsigemmobacter intermedius TaxID=1553448 RepID=A0A3S3VUG5_9RHOB|nr:aminopeptidase N [Falsigemmobacter intermedius]RWY42419.1 aminopeptidase N [Falsigemmobacter intermedius]